MKTLLVTLILLVFYSNIYPQNTDSKIDIKKITGLWYLPYHAQPTENIVFEKAKEGKMQWGSYISIEENGEVVVGHSARCGNDPNRFKNSGTWSFDAEKRIISFSIDVHKKGKVFVIQDISQNQLIFSQK